MSVCFDDRYVLSHSIRNALIDNGSHCFGPINEIRGPGLEVILQ